MHATVLAPCYAAVLKAKSISELRPLALKNNTLTFLSVSLELYSSKGVIALAMAPYC